MIGSTAEPTGGIPSLTDGEIYSLYQKYLHREPDGGELASERENALKYSAAGIERQIANRAGNVASSWIRGDEGLPSLTVPAPVYHEAQAGAIHTMGLAAVAPYGAATGPTGTMAPYYAPPPMYFPPAASGTIFGMSTTMLLVLAAMAAAAYYFLVIRK